MSSNSQLFLLQDSLQVNKKKTCADKKNCIEKRKKADIKKDTVSLSFYDDLQPIQLSGSYGIAYNMSAQWETDSFSYAETEEAAFSMENEPMYEEQQSIESYSFDHENTIAENESNTLVNEYPKDTNSSSGALSEYDIANDLSAILASDGGGKTSGTQQTAPQNDTDNFIKEALEKNKTLADTRKTDEAGNAEQPLPAENNHGIFDAIAKSMNYANAFDLGDFSLEQKFDLFDDESDKKKNEDQLKEKQTTHPGSYFNSAQQDKQKQNSQPGNYFKPAEPVVEDAVTTKNFIEDLDIISEDVKSLSATADKKTKTWPAAPTDLEQPSATKTKQLFGEFEYEDVAGSDSCEIKIKGTWAADNIEAVDIPQLKGKTNGTTGKEITKGVINFNKKAKSQLQKLWKAWEDAGLLDRIITYDGGFVPRHIKKKGGGCGTSLSNHAWGTAFDINAATNGLGVEPPLVGEKGCTRELVEIANKHGFYWGGHFTTKDGMHFEVAKIFE